VHELPPGWATDLAVLRYTGSSAEDHGDHLVMRKPDNPQYHWGNFVLITGTDIAHRGRGLAGHLLGVVARWSADRGVRRWVTVTEAINPAGRLYRRAGFRPDIGNAQVYRHPAVKPRSQT
jgi:GNAT superfamily N-acetyltransferase